MPWNNNDEGGGQGPWGQGPKGNPRNQNNWGGGGGGNRGPGSNLPPDLDELVRRGKDSLKGVIPGGGGGRGSWLVPLVLAAAFVVFNSLYQVQPDERGVVLRLGKYDRTVDPGLQFALWPIEKIEKPRVGTVRSITIGDNPSEGLMLTSDKNIISVPFTVQWQISDARSFLFNVAQQEKAISALAQTAMREVAAQTNAQAMLATGQVAVAQQVLQITQGLLDKYEAGVRLSSINLGNVQPPSEVADAFADVVRAEEDRKRLESEAQLYRNQRTQEAEGQSAKLVEEANAFKTATVSEATGEAARFLSVYEQYKVAKEVTRQRIFLETMENVLSKSNKVVIESGKNGQNGVVPYLPLPQVQKSNNQ